MTSKSTTPLLKLWLTFTISLLSIVGFSQDHVTMTLKNVSATTTTVDFDMFLVNDGTTPLKLAACSFGVNYNPSILNGGTPANGAFTFIAGTRDAGLNGLNTYTVVHTLARNHLRMTMSPQAEGSAPTLAPNVQYRIGTFRFTNTVLWTTNGDPAFALQLVLATGYTQCVATVYSNGNTVTNSLNTTGALPAGNINGTVISSIILNPAVTCAVTGSGTTTPITCSGGSNGTANITLAGVGSGAPGTYTVDNGPVQAYATNPFTVTGLTAGNHTIVATVTAGGCVSSDIIVNVGGPTSPNANAGIVSGLANICTGSLTTFSSDGDAGGVWSSTNTTVATVNNLGIVKALVAGSADITYTVNAGCNSPVSSFKTLTVTGNGTLAAVAGGAQVCSNALVQPAATQPSGTSFTDGSCNTIATILPSGLVPVSGNINTCVRIEDVVHTYHNLPYVQRVYDIMPAVNGANATATITLYYTQAEFDAYNVARGIYPPLPNNSADAAGIANILITQFHGTGTYPGNYNGGVVDLINPVDSKVVWSGAPLNRWEITFDVNGFSGFYLHTSLTNTPLPISLVSFSGHNNGGNNLLEWTTSSEANSNYFELQRSTDGINFVKAANIPAAGNSSTAKNYNYTDNISAINSNLFYYRLMQVDISGQVKYSTIVKIKLSIKGFNVEASPNPFADQLRVQIDATQKENAVITLNSLDGKKILQQNTALNKGSNAVLLDKLDNLAGGVYLLTVVTDTQKITVKVIKQK